MNPKFALGFLRITFSVLYYFLIFIFFGVIVAYVVQVATASDTNTGFNIFQYTAKGRAFQEDVTVTSADSIYQFKTVSNSYEVKVKPSTPQGVYALIGKLAFILLGIAALHQLRKIFRKSSIDDPFRTEILKRLKILSWLFIAGDLLRLIDYFIFNSLVRSSFPDQQFQLFTEFGDGFINAFIIWVIILVMQRGKEIKEEHALTV